MADTQTTTRELRFDMLFADTDTRTLTIKDPKTTITSTQIQDLETLILNGGVSTFLISDKTEAAFLKFTSVERVVTTKTTLDLS